MPKEIALLLTALAVAAAWVGFAEHPTARQLRKAVVATAVALLG
jgi:hypothetical protein